MKLILSNEFRKKIVSVIHVYNEIEHETALLCNATGLKCVNGCGQCCLNEKIEASPIEFLPLAVHLFTKNVGEELLCNFDKYSGQKRCIFFSNDNYEVGKWACTVHRLRPLICRLFGFYGMVTKNGKVAFASCRKIKENYPDNYSSAVKYISEKAPHMFMYNYYLKINMLGHDYENKLMPINEAMKNALEIVFFEINKGNWFNSFQAN